MLRREVRGGDARTGKGGDQDEGEAGEVGTVRRGRGGKGERGLGRRHSRASSLDRREIYQKYIHTDRSVHQFYTATASLTLKLRYLIFEMLESCIKNTWIKLHNV